MHERIIVVTLSVADLEDGGVLGHKFKEDDDLFPFHLPLYKIQPCFREKQKKLPFKRTFDCTHNYKLSSHNTCIII